VNGSGKKSLRDIIEEEAGEAGVGGFEAKQHTLSPEQVRGLSTPS